MNGIKRKPIKRREADQEQIESFIEGAEKPPEESEQEKTKKYPWDDANPEIIKTFNLRLPQPLKMKLDYIVERSPKSMHKFIMDEVEKAVKRELKKLEE